jgi:hypothetical protein
MRQLELGGDPSLVAIARRVVRGFANQYSAHNREPESEGHSVVLEFGKKKKSVSPRIGYPDEFGIVLARGRGACSSTSLVGAERLRGAWDGCLVSTDS